MQYSWLSHWDTWGRMVVTANMMEVCCKQLSRALLHNMHPVCFCIYCMISEVERLPLHCKSFWYLRFCFLFFFCINVSLYTILVCACVTVCFIHVWMDVHVSCVCMCICITLHCLLWEIGPFLIITPKAVWMWTVSDIYTRIEGAPYDPHSSDPTPWGLQGASGELCPQHGAPWQCLDCSPLTPVLPSTETTDFERICVLFQVIHNTILVHPNVHGNGFWSSILPMPASNWPLPHVRQILSSARVHMRLQQSEFEKPSGYLPKSF